MIVDSHQHFWRVALGHYGWLEQAPVALQRDFLPRDLQGELVAGRVARTILVQAAPTEAETDFLLDLAAHHDFIAGIVGWAEMDAPEIGKTLAALRTRPGLVGIRPMLHDLADPRWLLRPAVRAALSALVDADLALDIVCNHTQLPMVGEALAATPGLRAVLDHLGNPPIAHGMREPWARDLAALARFPNLHCKVSGLITLATDNWRAADLVPWIDHARAEFGAARLMWGSDWPVCLLAGGYADTLDSARSVLEPMLTVAELDGVFGGNAARFYRV